MTTVTYSAYEAAWQLNITYASLRRKARRTQIGKRVGTHRVYEFTPEDIANLRQSDRRFKANQ